MARLLMAIWLAAGALFATAAPAGTPLPLSGQAAGQDIAPVAAVWRDTAADADLAAAEAAYRRGEFRPTGGTTTFGIDPAPHWFRFELQRPADAPPLWWIEIPHPGLDDVRLHIPDQDGTTRIIRLGDHRPFAERPVDHRNFIFPVSLPAGKATALYLRVQTADTLIVPMRIWLPERFAVADAREATAIGLYYGLILAMIAYNLYLFIKLRDGLYGTYLCFSFVILLVVAELNGQAFQYLWPDNLWIADHQHILIPAAAIFAAIAFMRRLFDLPIAAPLLDHSLRALGWLTALAVAIGLAVDYGAGHQLLLMLMPLQSIAGILAGIKGLARSFRPAVYFLVAQACFQGAVLTVVGNALGLWSLPLPIQHSIGIGSTFEVMLFSQVLAERVAGLRHATQQALVRAVVAETERAEILARSERRLTELIAEKEQALRSRDQAEVASKTKSKILAAASHDLRQPIQALRLFVSALQQRSASEEMRGIVGKMEASLRALSELLDTFLNISRLDAGVIRPDPRPQPMSELFSRLIDEFEVQATEAGLSLRGWLPPDDVVVRTDPGLLLAILRNLLANAVRYTPRGGILIACRRRGGGVALQVWDTGIGIPATERERIFEEFYQIEDGSQNSRKGLGLGLAIVDRTARLLDYRITVRSKVGRGTMVEVAIPGGAELPAAPPALPAPAEAAANRGVIVLVDDDPDILEGMRLCLADAGYAVLAVRSAAAALDLAAVTQEKPDLVVSDYHLGDGRRGSDVIAAIRRIRGAEVAGLIFTGETTPQVLHDIQRSGLPLLHKPADAETLLARVSALLQAETMAPTAGLA